MFDCIFCKIVNGDIPTDLIYESKTVVAFHDINPQAPIHILVIPKKHINTLNDIDKIDKNLLGDLQIVASEIAKIKKIEIDGYRTIINCNKNGGQTVFHIHLHLIGGRKLNWPPG